MDAPASDLLFQKIRLRRDWHLRHQFSHRRRLRFSFAFLRQWKISFRVYAAANYPHAHWWRELEMAEFGEEIPRGYARFAQEWDGFSVDGVVAEDGRENWTVFLMCQCASLLIC